MKIFFNFFVLSFLLISITSEANTFCEKKLPLNSGGNIAGFLVGITIIGIQKLSCADYQISEQSNSLTPVVENNTTVILDNNTTIANSK